MVASSLDPEANIEAVTTQSVGNTRHLNRHNTQMFVEGRSFSGNERDKLWFNRGDGTFLDVSPFSGADSKNDGRAIIAADFDDDGDIDLFVHELQRERHALYRNELGTSQGQFLKVRLRATQSQYEAIGAVVTLRFGPTEKSEAESRFPASAQVSQIMSRGTGIGSCQPPELVFGMSDAPSAHLSVRWPDGSVEAFGAVAPGQRLWLVQGTGQPEPFAANPRPLPDPTPAGLKLALGDRVPTFAVQNAAGETSEFDVAKVAPGQRVYLNLWASYCGPCVQELPDLQKLDEQGEATVVGLSVDAAEGQARAAKLFATRGARFASYYLPAQEEGTSIDSWADMERLPIPTTLVIGADGTLERVIRGPIPKALIESASAEPGQ